MRQQSLALCTWYRYYTIADFDHQFKYCCTASAFNLCRSPNPFGRITASGHWIMAILSTSGGIWSPRQIYIAIQSVSEYHARNFKTHHLKAAEQLKGFRLLGGLLWLWLWLLHNLVEASFDLFRYLLLGDQNGQNGQNQMTSLWCRDTHILHPSIISCQAASYYPTSWSHHVYLST